MTWRVKAGAVPPARGMLDAETLHRVATISKDGSSWRDETEVGRDVCWGHSSAAFRPDVTDPATACLLMLWAAEQPIKGLASEAVRDRGWTKEDARRGWRIACQDAMLDQHAGGVRLNADVPFLAHETVESILRALGVVEDL